MGKHRKRVILKWMLIAILSATLLLIVIGLLSMSSRDRGVLLSREQRFTWESQDRRYLLSRAKVINDSSRLIVGLHGFKHGPRHFAYYTGLHNAARDTDVILYPKALDPTETGQFPGWNSSFCCGSGWVNDADDVGFIVTLSQQIAAEFGIAANQVYVTGYSNGAMMTQRLGTERPDAFRAIAARSGSIGTNKTRLSPTAPIPVLLSHGTADKSVPIEGGATQSEPDFNWLPYKQTVSAWQSINKDIVPTEQIIHDGEGHIWHDWRLFNFWHRSPAGSREVMNFFDNL